jgi:death on curing protein
LRRLGPPTVYPTLTQVERTLAEIMRRTGAALIYRQGGQDLLASALARPINAALYGRADLLRQATLLAVGISQNHPFVDGNKRAAYAATEIFLLLNGVELTGDPLEGARLLEAVAAATTAPARRRTQARLEKWLRAAARPQATD